jgi:hypothetical protein
MTPLPWEGHFYCLASASVPPGQEEVEVGRDDMSLVPAQFPFTWDSGVSYKLSKTKAASRLPKATQVPTPRVSSAKFSSYIRWDLPSVSGPGVRPWPVYIGWYRG